MAEIAEVADGIYRLSLLRPPRGCVIHFIAGERTSLIETGPAVIIPGLLDSIRQLGYDPAKLDYIFLTHIHLDHAGGVGTFARQFPQVKVFVHPRGARHLVDPSRLIVDTKRAYGEKFEDQYGFILPVSEGQVRTLEDGE
ncbi:MAG: MBL fold metallo-hydrolase, partial [Dehalococcoidia bacterium]|nr:MBL fold metallo-hydrolase [Dehalococcoidia bacterium]